jgi:hypothetical protein
MLIRVEIWELCATVKEKSPRQGAGCYCRGGRVHPAEWKQRVMSVRRNWERGLGWLLQLH